ncbi:hypothetical protein AC578_9022 [Pseudocercospora eumusae]|uniref:Uncharacterized protein n=1 Tax=Pseudocercospora eumusae TaxID=321146 RepID=A0A139H2R2_9PEZI|nr:hypothetical protein AC578_9022 [Pseudocercospora eumusae]
MKHLHDAERRKDAEAIIWHDLQFLARGFSSLDFTNDGDAADGFSGILQVVTDASKELFIGDKQASKSTHPELVMARLERSQPDFRRSTQLGRARDHLLRIHACTEIDGRNSCDWRKCMAPMKAKDIFGEILLTAPLPRRSTFRTYTKRCLQHQKGYCYSSGPAKHLSA